jgi:hypothetical protein
MEKSGELFCITYEGEDAIDLSALLTSQAQLLLAIQEVQHHLFPEVTLTVKASGTRKGSFALFLLLEHALRDQLFSKITVDGGMTVLKTIGEVIKLHKLLGGKKPKEVKEVGNDQIQVTAAKGSVVIVNTGTINLYEGNPIVTTALQTIFQQLDRTGTVSGMRIEQKPEKGRRKQVVRVPKKDFEKLAAENPYKHSQTADTISPKETLFIEKPDLWPKKNKAWNWALLHRGRNVKANILDQEFRKTVDEGLRLAQGDRLVADLKTFMRYDEKLQTWRDTGRYAVVKVHDIIRRTEQSKLDFDAPQ